MKLLRPFNKWTTYKGHEGIDYPEKDNTMVKASAKGVVTFSGYFSDRAGYGVTVDYGGGVVAKYKHSDKYDWRAPTGTRVEQGDPIMQVGMLGVGSTGYHLHHEIFKNGAIQTDDNYWKYVDKSENGYVGAPSSAGNEDKPDEKRKRKLKMHEALIVNRESNKLLIVNLKDKTLIDLGNDAKSGLRAYYANNFPWSVVGEPEWTTRFKDYKYI